MRYFIVIIILVLAGCGKGPKGKSDTSVAFSGNARNPDSDPIAKSDSANSSVTSGSYGTPIRAGRWDPSAEKQRPMKGGSRTRQKKHIAMINDEARKAKMDPIFVHAIISQESRYNTNARSNAGAEGLMQIMPATAKQLGLSPSMRRSHPRANVRAGIKYLSQMKWAKGNLQAMAAGYNSGPARAKALLIKNTNSRYWRGAQPSTSNGVPGKRFWGGETYHYASRVAGYFELYSANPQLIGLGGGQNERSYSCQRRGLC